MQYTTAEAVKEKLRQSRTVSPQEADELIEAYSDLESEVQHLRDQLSVAEEKHQCVLEGLRDI